MKLLNEETLLVGEYPPGVADGPFIEANLNYILNNFKTCYGRDFKVVRIPMPPDQYGLYPNNGGDYRTYTNSMIVNKTIIIPTYELRYDTTAFRIYREAMPGYNIVGINSNAIIPSLGTIHCIVKEVGANNPIHISHATLDSVADSSHTYPVIAAIRTNTGVQTANLHWTTDTTIGFQSIPMDTAGQDSFMAAIPQQLPGTRIFYYLEAQASSGKTRTLPMTAPQGFFQFSVSMPTAIAGSGKNLPDQIRLLPGYPNPFNSRTSIKFYLPVKSNITLEIYNSVGQRIHVLSDGSLNSGWHTFHWDAEKVSSGIYFYRLHAEDFSETRKLLYIK
jgi:hypothetical protein